jgi:lysophospholipase L1-like esterase
VAIVTGFLLMVVALEVTFRIVHAWSMHETETRVSEKYQVASLDPETIRIAVLGESTSAHSRIGNRDIAWPAQLEAVLNSRFAEADRSVKFRVFNLARAASSSPFQVSSFSQQVELLKPDILISMLGVNDARVYPLKGNVFYENSYLFRFLYWAEVAWSCPRCQELNVVNEAKELFSVSNRGGEFANEAIAKLTHDPIATIADLDRFKVWFSELERESGEDQHLMNGFVSERLFSTSQQPALRGTDLSRSILLEAKSILDRSYREMVLKRHSSLEHYSHIRVQLREPGCVAAAKEAFQAGLAVTPQLMTIVAQEGPIEDEFFRKLYRNAGFEMSADLAAGRILQQSFRRLESIVKEYDIVWMPMQYPTGSVGSLEYFLSDEANQNAMEFSESFYLPAGRYVPRSPAYILISNENFKSRLLSEKESEYFTDFFGRGRGLNFGHTTEKGHALIAANVADQIERSWPEIEPRILEGRHRRERP